MKNKLEDLRNHLFESLERLSDPECKVDIQREKAIAETGRVLIESGKLEVMALTQAGRKLESDLWKARKPLTLVGESGGEN